LRKPPERWLSLFVCGGCFGGCWDRQDEISLKRVSNARRVSASS